MNTATTTILVADDDPDMRALYHRFLGKNGYNPILAEDGVQAIRLFRERLPDLVLMDAGMPGMDGFETSVALHNLFPSLHVPIIMVTGWADEESVNKAFRSGAEEYITKPINWAVLRHRMGTILEHRRVGNALRESEERFRSLAQSSNDAIISADQTGGIIFWNQGASRCFGYAAAEVQSRPLTLLIPERFRAAHQQGLTGILETGRLQLAGQTVELVGLHKNGREFPLEITLSSWVMGNSRFFSAIIRDISARKQLERERQVAMQTRIAISALLETALEPLTMSRQLAVALDILHTLPWWAHPAKSSIFLNNEKKKILTLAVWKGWESAPTQPCACVSQGVCLCGLPTANREIIFRNGLHPRGQFPENYSHYCVPILFQQQLLGVLNVYLPPEHAHNREEEGVLHTISQTLATIIERRRMEEALEHSHAVLKETRLEIIHRLGMASEFRDNETGLHIVRMSQYAALLGQAAGLDEASCDILLNAAPMHDVGKIGIADSILLKPGRLTEEEFKIMKTHTSIGAHMLFGHEEEPLKTAHIIALTHHERWDGQGYPHGLAGEAIPLVGRICALSDVFDALTSERPYKRAWRVEDAVAELQRGAGTQFDPRIVALFLDNMPHILKIKEQFQDDLENLPLLGTSRYLHGFSAFIHWDGRLDTGVASVDKEHKNLVTIVNKLYHALGSSAPDQAVLDILGDLEDFTAVHFTNEEAMLHRLSDPWISEHLAEHQMFMDHLANVHKKYRHGSEEEIKNLMIFLRKLLLDHVLNMDKRSFIPGNAMTSHTGL